MSTNIDYWEKVVKNPSLTYKKLFEQEKDYLRKNINNQDIVLDVGCGDGRNILSIVDIAKKIVGIDIDEKAIFDAKENLKDYHNVEIVLGSAFELPFEDKEFTKVILSMTLVNFNDYKTKALKELKRVVTDNGKILISVYSEKAKEERLKMYTEIGVPIDKIQNNKFIFDKSVGAHTSEQFSLNDFQNLIKEVRLQIKDCEEVEGLAYLFTLVREVRE